MKPGYLPKKYCGPEAEEVDVAFVELDDTLKYWDHRIEGWRLGIVKTIGPVYFHVLVAHMVRKIRRDDERLYLVRENQTLLIVGGNK